MSFHKKLSLITLLTTLATSVLGHGYVTGIVADGTYYPGWQLVYYYQKQNTGTFTKSIAWYSENTDMGFVAPSAYNTSDIICHKAAEPGALTATVAAGGTVDFQWTDFGHPGPIMTYVAKCPGDCTDAALDKTALEFVKIDEAGIDIASQTWATTDLAANNYTWSVKVPATLETGNYVFRHEIIAVHGSGSKDGAQNYPQCLNIAVTGGSTTSSTGGTLGTALYKETDPGILFNPYATLTEYVIPGPALMAGTTTQEIEAVDAGQAKSIVASASIKEKSIEASGIATTFVTATSKPVIVAEPTISASVTIQAALVDVTPSKTYGSATASVTAESTVKTGATEQSSNATDTDTGDASTEVPTGLSVTELLTRLQALITRLSSTT